MELKEIAYEIDRMIICLRWQEERKYDVSVDLLALRERIRRFIGDDEYYGHPLPKMKNRYKKRFPYKKAKEQPPAFFPNENVYIPNGVSIQTEERTTSHGRQVNPETNGKSPDPID